MAPFIGALIGAGLSAASSIAGGIMSSRAAREAKEKTDAANAELEAHYTRKANEDPLQRAGAQAMITRTADELRRAGKAAQGRQAVMGGTEASVAATKEAAAKALGQTVTNAAVIGEQARERAEENLINVRMNKAVSDAQSEAARAQNVAQATAGAGQIAGSIATSLSNMPAKAPAKAPTIDQELNTARADKMADDTGAMRGQVAHSIFDVANGKDYYLPRV